MTRHTPRLTVAALAAVGTVAAGIGLMTTAAFLILRAAGRPPILDLTLAIVGVRFFGIARAALRYGERLAGHDAALRIAASLRRRAVQAIDRITPGGLPSGSSADLLSRVTADVEEAQESVVRTTLPAAAAAVTVIGAAAFAWAFAPAAGIALLAGGGITAVGAVAAVTLAAAAGERRLSPLRAALLTTATVDLIDGNTEAEVYGRTGDLLASAEAADRALRRAGRLTAWSTGLGSAIAALGTGITLWWVVRASASAAAAGSVDTLVPGVLAVLTLAAFEPIHLLPRAAAGASDAREAVARLRSLDAAATPVATPAEPARIESPVLALRGAWVRAEPDGAWIIKDVDIELRPGRRVALIGASGGGKTTLAETLLRFREVGRGDYTIGGLPAAALDPAEVRRVVGLAAEEAHLVAGSVLDNLRIADADAGHDAAAAVLAAVGLGDWLGGLPDGLDTLVGERGTLVSGGERRRIALARALLGGFPILIVDEPTANLDPAAARRVVGEILDAAAGRGVLLITHGTEGLDAVDEIIVLGDGAVIERGSHHDLAAAGGVYARLASGG